MRLIDADALLAEVIKNNSYKVVDYTITFDYGEVAAINNAPTIDAEPVRHGRREVYPDSAHLRCTACKIEFQREKMPIVLMYCPNCGAKMDGGASDA